MQFTQRYFPLDLARHTEAGAKDVLFYTADLPDGNLLCVVHAREPVSDSKYLLHVSITVRPVWGTLRGRRATDEELAAVQQFFSKSPLKEDNRGVREGFVRNLREVEAASSDPKAT